MIWFDKVWKNTKQKLGNGNENENHMSLSTDDRVSYLIKKYFITSHDTLPWCYIRKTFKSFVQ